MPIQAIEDIGEPEVRNWFRQFAVRVCREARKSNWSSVARALVELGVYEDSANFEEIFGRRNWRDTARLAYLVDHQEELRQLARRILERHEAFRPLHEFMQRNGSRNVTSVDRWAKWWPWAKAHFFDVGFGSVPYA